MKIFAQFISFITNPFLVSAPVPFILLYRSGYDHVYAVQWTMYSLVFNLLVVVFVFYAVKRGIFSNIDVSRREQRPVLFSAVAVAALLYLTGLLILNAPQVLFDLVWGAIIGIAMAFFINMRIKASLHTAVVTAVLLVMIKLSMLPYVIFLLVPVVGWSRVILKKHTVSEIIAGCILGIALTFITYHVLKYVHGY